MFAFELPWQRGSGDGLAAMSHGQSTPPSLTKYYPKVHPAIDQIIAKCLIPEPENRLQSMKEVLLTLAPLKNEEAD